MSRPRRNLGADHSAAAALEFAMVCLAFSLFLLGIMILGLDFYSREVLDFATDNAARQVQLGRVPPGYAQADFLDKVFCPTFSLFLTCSNLFIDVRPVTDYQSLASSGGADAPNSKGTTGYVLCPGQPGQLMYMHVVYMPSSLSTLFGLTDAAGAIISNASFANENPTGLAVTPTSC